MRATLYDVLGVAPEATTGALRAARRERARQHHPDSATGDAAAMRSLNEAWAVLSDPVRRAAYDRFLADGALGHRESAGRGRHLPACAGRSRAKAVRLWPFLVIGAGLLVVVTAYAGLPADTRTEVEPVGQCLVQGANRDRTEPCRSAGGARIVAVGGPGVRCPEGTDVRALRGDAERRTVCVSRVAGR